MNIIGKTKVFMHTKNKTGEKLEKNIMAIEWKKFEQNNMTITPDVLFVPHNTKTIRLAYKSKYNRKRKNPVVLLMINDGKK